jgi:penicillin-binding protein 1A
MSIVRILSLFFFTGVLGITFLLGAIFFLAHNKCVDFSVLENYNPGRPSIVLDDEGNEWARFQLDRREPITLAQMPPHLVQAFIAAEDWNFFNHSGISWKGIARSMLVNLYHFRIVQGASTITQQLVKLLFFDMQRTFNRKIKEQVWALLVEQQFTKEQILQTYLNHIYFGCGIYGVEAASQRFWGKHAADVTIDEAAVLAAIVRSPAHYCPILCPLSSQGRRNVILSQMKKLNFIDVAQYEQAKKSPVQVKMIDADILAPHLKETLRQFLEELVGKQKLYCGGLTIQTTLNQKIQRQAEKHFSDHVQQLKGSLPHDVDGALITIDVKTGEIRALVGGYDFAVSKFNRALQARRQIGSVIKPLIYAQAVKQGMTFADTEIDEPFQLEDNGHIWAPGNYNREFDGRMTLACALSRSNNIIAIKTLLKVGVHKVIDLAKNCRMQGPFYPYPSLALGCVDATLKESVGMFNIFANDGVWVEPHYLKWIKDSWGAKIWKKSPESFRVLDSRVSGQVTKVLSLGLERARTLWTGQSWLDSEAISKTGTTNDSRTCWFVGSTPRLTTAVYIGCDDNRSLGKNVYPLVTAFPIWRMVHTDVSCSQKKFSYDPSLQERIVDEKTGTRVYSADASGAIKILV